MAAGRQLVPVSKSEQSDTAGECLLHSGHLRLLPSARSTSRSACIDIICQVPPITPAIIVHSLNLRSENAQVIQHSGSVKFDFIYF